MHTPVSRIRASAVALAVLGALAAGQAGATGFQLREQSVRNLGTSNAGSIVGADASHVSLNPAAMTTLAQRTFKVDATVIDLNADFTGGGSVLAGTPLAAPLSGGNGGDPGDATVVPNVSAVFPVGERMAVGVAIGAPFGLKTEYAPGWVGRYRALTSDVKAVDLTLSAAFKASDTLSLGVGLVYERAEATLSKAIDFGALACATSPAAHPTIPNCHPASPFPFKPQAHDGGFSVTGDDTAFGFLVGLHAAPTPQLELGLAYRSELKHELEGRVDFDTLNAPFIALNPANAARFADGPGGARLTTPAILTASASYAVSDRLRVMGDWQRTGWSSLESVVIARADGTVVGVEPFAWRDSDFFSLGLEFDASDALTLRGGIGRDESPTNDLTRTPRLPDNDRMLYSVGLTWQLSPSLSIDAAYQRITIDDPKIDLHPEPAAGEFSSLVGSFSGDANLVGVSMSYRF
jgi:long-chain fatty acid transport protein